uniref:Integrase catalytic domain-containing protein n=1 Tax=Physcomitrium patens TaxID=3218 RepID=A0A2K1LBW2_PHYPA|nr:hypothetical protein PHYPA_001950 [Physcomitrium patens]
MVEVEKRVDAQQFVEILEKHLLFSIEKSGISKKEVIFQQDNDPKYNSKLIWKWFDHHGIKVMN